MIKIIESINSLRAVFHGKDLQSPQILTQIVKYIEQDSNLKNIAALKAFVVDANSFIQEKSPLREVKNHIDSQIDRLVFSAFNALYFKELSLDAFYYEPLIIPPLLKQELKSPVFPVKILQATKGFYAKDVVALFPENHIDQIQLPQNNIFYFIDKFVDRFFKITKKLLEAINQDQFQQLRQATATEIEQASICWVCLHEFFHRQGHMPIPQYLDVKSTKALAGLEELRVDLLSIFYCLNNPNTIENPKFIAEFILIERLLRYAVEGGVAPNYDAIASQVLFNYLLKNAAIIIDDNYVLTIQENIFDILYKFYAEINSIEALITEDSRHVVKGKLLKFVNSNLQSENGEYKHNSYICWLKTKFAV